MASDNSLSPDYPGYQDPDAAAYDLLGLSPLKSMGIDPDQARTNPQAALQSVRTGQPMAKAAPSASTAQAATLGGGGATPAPVNPSTSAPFAYGTPNRQQTAGNLDPQLQQARDAYKAVLRTPSAASTSTPTVTPGSVTPSGDPAQGSPYRGYPQRATQAQDTALEGERRNIGALQNLGSIDQTVAPLEKQRQQAATPINPQAAQYRPSFGQRLVRGVGAGLEGLAKGGIVGAAAGALDPKLVGGTAYGAPNKAYDIATQQQQGTVGNLDQQLEEARNNYKANVERQNDLAQRNQDLAAGYGGEAKNSAAAMEAENKPPKELPEGEIPLGSSVSQLNSILADRYHVLNPGKPVPSQYVLPADATQKDYDRIDKGLSGVEGAQGTQAQRKQADSFRQTALDLAASRRSPAAPKAMPAGVRDRIESQKNTAINKAKSDFDSGVSSMDDYLNAWQQAQDDYEQRIQAQTGQPVPHLDIRNNVDSRGNWIGSKQPAAQNAAARPQSGSGNQQRFVTKRGNQVSIGAEVNVDGRRGTVTGFNAKTGKAQVRWENGQ